MRHSKRHGRGSNHKGGGFKLQAEVEEAETVVKLLQANQMDTRPEVRLTSILDTLVNQYEVTENHKVLDEAIRLGRAGINSTPAGNPRRVALLKRLYSALLIRFDKLSETKDLDEAVSIARDAVQSVPKEDPQRKECLDLLASALDIRCLLNSDPADVEEALALVEGILADDTAEGEKRATWLAYLGRRRKERYKDKGDISDLDRAISAMSQALEIGPSGDTDLPTLEVELGSLLEARYDRLGKPNDLDESIRRTRRALAAMESDHPIRATALSNLANQLGASFERTGHVDELDEAIIRATEANDIEEVEGEDKVAGLNTLANWLAVRYDRTGKAKDIEKSISFAEEALRLADENDSTWPAFANNLATTLVDQYIDTGNLENLQKAIKLLEKALDKFPKNDPDSLRTACEITLSQALNHLYQRTGNLPEIEWAVSLSRSAANQPDLDPLDRGIYLNTLGDNLEVLYDRTGDLTHINAAIAAEEKAASIFPPKHGDHARTLRSLADKLRCLYGQTRKPIDLEKALRTARLALNDLPKDHPERGDYLDSLATLLEDLSELSSNHVASLDEAVDMGEKAVSVTPTTGTSYALLLSNQGRRLEKRHHSRNQEQQERKGHNKPDLKRAIEFFRKASESVEGQPAVRIRAGRSAARLLCSIQQWEQAARIVDGLASLLPLICGRYASRTDQQYAVNQTSGLAADACSLTLKSGGSASKALQQLEFGRGLILNYAIENRTTIDRDLDRLRREEPRLASLFESLQFRAAGTGSRPLVKSGGGAAEDKEKGNESEEDGSTEEINRPVINRINATQELNELLDTIRQIPAFRRFLMEPTMEEMLSHATARQGPLIVVNVTEISSDALILARDGIHHVPLPSIQPDGAPKPFHWSLQKRRDDDDAGLHRFKQPRNMASETVRSWWSGSALAWLWRTCVGPVLDEAHSRGLLVDVNEDSALPRVWWNGAGIASSFPFHAAGSPWMPGAMDRVVSSYCPTARALWYSRSRAAAAAATSITKGRKSVLVVTMADTPGHRPLPGADREGAEVQRVFQDTAVVYGLLWLRCPTATTVMESLHASNILHFAGHGLCDALDPSQSCLLLQKPGSVRKREEKECSEKENTRGADEGGQELPVVDRLTVARISAEAERGKNRAWLAFLSACSTAEVAVPALASEGIHLASAFQLAGFPHVVGSLWPVDDDVCVDVAGRFYRGLLASEGANAGRNDEVDGRVARALREAVVGVQKEHPDNPELWAPFVHFGA
ncbi:CHAT domain-containing protein [Cercophora scortea]|uniref:CHAT domain-containing protein n=1 Tax=Cercophora scortea TaxID=314031 RepID=A0AAE0I2G3_9PEZI|nr:CHAT domain-containing protein [Cercophora scortea]